MLSLNIDVSLRDHFYFFVLEINIKLRWLLPRHAFFIICTRMLEFVYEVIPPNVGDDREISWWYYFRDSCLIDNGRIREVSNP